jgi:hypothetical protein
MGPGAVSLSIIWRATSSRSLSIASQAVFSNMRAVRYAWETKIVTTITTAEASMTIYGAMG